MLALRLVRGAPPLVLLRRLLVVCAVAGVGFLLLSALGYALAHPEAEGPARVRLLWCLVPLAAAVHLTATVARTETGGRVVSGLDAAGVGPARLPLLAATSATLFGVLGSALGSLVFLVLRGDVPGTPYSGVAAELLGGRRSMPTAAAVTLLCVTPLLAAGASALAVRAVRTRRGTPVSTRTESDVTESATSESATPARTSPPERTPRRGTSVSAYPGTAGAPEAGPPHTGPICVVEAPQRPIDVPRGTSWGTALVSLGVALIAFTHDGPLSALRGGQLLPLPGTLDDGPLGAVLGWLLTAGGLVLAVPGLMYLSGWLISLGHPGVVRLLTGRLLQVESGRVGRPLGALCTVAAGGLAVLHMYGDLAAGGPRVFGPLTALGAVLVLCCVSGSLLTATGECRRARATAHDTLRHLGAPRALLRRTAALRAVALTVLLVPVIWAVATLAALPLKTAAG